MKRSHPNAPRQPETVEPPDGAGYGADDCLRCGTPMDNTGTESFRVGGSTGGTSFLFGRLAELGEGLADFEIWVCPNCRKVELRVP